MTEENQEKSTESKKPTHTIYAKTYINGNPINVRVGAAWKHSKGTGFNIQIDQMVAFENKPKEDKKNDQN